MQYLCYGACLFLSVMLVACGGGSSSGDDGSDDGNDTPASLSLAGFWDLTSYENGTPPHFGYRVVKIAESGVYTTYNFKLDDTGDIELCIFDQQGTLEHVTADYYLDTVTYPAFELPTIKERTLVNGELHDVVFDYTMPPVDQGFITLEELQSVCGADVPDFDLTGVEGLWDLSYGVISIDAQGFTSVFYFTGGAVSSELNRRRLIPTDSGDFMMVGLHWVAMDALDYAERIRPTVDGNLEVDFLIQTVELEPYVDMTLPQLLAASVDNSCSERQWHVVDAIGLTYAELKSSPATDAATTCPVSNATNVLINPLSSAELTATSEPWVFVKVPDAELSCSGEYGYVAAADVRLGAAVMIAGQDG